MTPNINVINKVMAAIEAEEIAKFDMTLVIGHDYEQEHPCGTAGCIYGFTLMAHYDVKNPDNYYGNENIPTTDSEEIRQIFGMEYGGVGELFFSMRSMYPLSAITKSMALEALEDVKLGNFKSWTDYA